MPCITYNFSSVDSLIFYNALIRSEVEGANAIWN